MTSVIGQIIVDFVVRPAFAVWITLSLHWHKALLYSVLVIISGLLIGITCICGQWIATRLLLPIERDIYQVRRIQRSFADEHANDTRIVIDNHNNSKKITITLIWRSAQHHK